MDRVFLTSWVIVLFVGYVMLRVVSLIPAVRELLVRWRDALLARLLARSTARLKRRPQVGREDDDE